MDALQLGQRQGDAVIGGGQVHAAELAVGLGEVHPYGAAQHSAAQEPGAGGDRAFKPLPVAHQQRQRRLHPFLPVAVGQRVPGHGGIAQGVAAREMGQIGGTIVELEAAFLLPQPGYAAACQGKRQTKGQDYGDDASHWASPPSARGSVTVNTVPRPLGRWAAVMVPPRAATVSCTMLSPRPVPPMARERILSTR